MYGEGAAAISAISGDSAARYFALQLDMNRQIIANFCCC